MNLPHIKNPQFPDANNYVVKSARPVLFFVTQPGSFQPLYEVCLALHVNPSSLSETYSKNKNVVSTYGGFVEFHWPDELDSFAAEGSTGAFINPEYGFTGSEAEKRSNTMAYERFQDFLELFHNNGMVFDGNGRPTIRGRIAMIMDRGVYYGHFTSFSVTEEVSNPYMFTLDWDFKVETTILKIPVSAPLGAFNTPSGDSVA